MNPPLMLVGLIGSIVALSFLIGYGTIFYLRNTNVKFSLLNRFMFEIMLALNVNQRRLIQIPLALLFASIATFFFASFVMPNIILTYLILAAAILASLTYGLLFYIKTTYVDRHVLVASLAMMLTLVLALLVGYYAFATPFDTTYNEVLKYGSLILAMWQLAIMVNPRLKNWGQLTEQKDGETISYSRPRIFVLPLSEWLSLFNLIILQVIVTISVFI